MGRGWGAGEVVCVCEGVWTWARGGLKGEVREA